MWPERLAVLSPDLEFQSAASEDAIGVAERATGVGFPDELRSFLLEADGLRGKHRVGLVWPSARIAKDNSEFRHNADFATLYMPFNPLLFFGDAGNGDQFAFAIVGGEVRGRDISFGTTRTTAGSGWRPRWSVTSSGGSRAV